MLKRVWRMVGGIASRASRRRRGSVPPHASNLSSTVLRGKSNPRLLANDTLDIGAREAVAEELCLGPGLEDNLKASRRMAIDSEDHL